MALSQLTSSDAGFPAREKINAGLRATDGNTSGVAQALDIATRVSLYANALSNRVDNVNTAAAEGIQAALRDAATRDAARIVETTGLRQGLDLQTRLLSTVVGRPVPSQIRPGDGAHAFTFAASLAALGGRADALDPLSNERIAFTPDGTAARVVGAGIIAAREAEPVEPGRVRAVRTTLVRSANASDPNNDTVRSAVLWLDAAENPLPGAPIGIIKDFTALTTASGRQTAFGYIASAPGDGITLVAPSGAKFYRRIVQSFGLDGVSDIQVLAGSDVTGQGSAAVPSPDVLARLDALESENAGQRLAALEAAGLSPDSRAYASRSDAQSSTPPASAKSLLLLGDVTQGDAFLRTYVRVASAPTDGTDYLTTADGVFWARVALLTDDVTLPAGALTPSMPAVSLTACMSKGDLPVAALSLAYNGSDRDTDRINAMLAEQPGRCIRFPARGITVARPIDLGASQIIRGQGTAGSGAAISAPPGYNGPIVRVASAADIDDIAVIGSATQETVGGKQSTSDTSTMPLQACIRIERASNVKIGRNVFLSGGFDLLNAFGDASGTPFYQDYDARFYECVRDCLHLASSHPAGIDYRMAGARITSGDRVIDHAHYVEGLGSYIIDRVQASVIRARKATFRIASRAPLQGQSLMTASVWENGGGTDPDTGQAIKAPAGWIGGTLDRPIHWLSTQATNFGGPSAGLQIDFLDKADFDNVSAGGNRYGLLFTGVATRTTFRAPLIECLDLPIAFDTANMPTTGDYANGCLDLTIIDPQYSGGFPVFSATNVPHERFRQLTLTVSSPSMADEPVQAAAIQKIPGRIDVFGSPLTMGRNKEIVFYGLTDGTGSFKPVHGIDGLNNKVKHVDAGYRGGSGEWRPMTVTAIDGSNVYATIFPNGEGGTSNTPVPCRVNVTYGDRADTWAR